MPVLSFLCRSGLCKGACAFKRHSHVDDKGLFPRIVDNDQVRFQAHGVTWDHLLFVLSAFPRRDGIGEARQDVVVAFAQQAHMSGAVVQDVCGGFLLCIAAATAAIRDVLPRPVSGCSCGEEV